MCGTGKCNYQKERKRMKMELAKKDREMTQLLAYLNEKADISDADIQKIHELDMEIKELEEVLSEEM